MGGDGRLTGDEDLVTRLSKAGVTRGDLVGLAVTADGTAAVTAADGGWVSSAAELVLADHELRPRWVTWSQDSARHLVASGVSLATCWDIATVHRLLFGGWRADPGWAWACVRGLPLDGVPAAGPSQSAAGPDLFDAADEYAAGRPVRLTPAVTPRTRCGRDGQLRPEWARGGWAAAPARRLAWARLARQTAGLQASGARRGDVGATGVATARCESTVELLCAELSAEGLPMDRAAAEAVLTGIIGPRPRGKPRRSRCGRHGTPRCCGTPPRG